MMSVTARFTRRISAVGLSLALVLGAPSALAEKPAAAGPVAAMGALAYASDGEGALYRSDGQTLYRSTNDGQNWTALALPAQAQAGTITSIKAAAGKTTLYVAGPGAGVLRSDDGGKSWSALEGLPSKQITTFATHSTLPDTLYAVVADEGIFRSEDAGKHWKLMDKGPRATIRRLIHTNMEGSMQTGWLFAATDKGVYRSMDCFCGFRRAGDLAAHISAVTYDPKQPAQVFVSKGTQVFVSENGGEAWQPVNSPGEATALLHTPGGKLLALLRGGQLMESADDGKRWKQIDG